MFENYQFDGVYIAIQAVLTLYAQGEFKYYLKPKKNSIYKTIIVFDSLSL